MGEKHWGSECRQLLKGSCCKGSNEMGQHLEEGVSSRKRLSPSLKKGVIIIGDYKD